MSYPLHLFSSDPIIKKNVHFKGSEFFHAKQMSMESI